MKQRILLGILVGISLVLAVTLCTQQAYHAGQEQSLALLHELSETELARFHGNVEDFYKYHSTAARKRLRTLYYQIQYDPESERLTKTMKDYVDWVNRFGDPATMRRLHSLSMDARVKALHEAVQESSVFSIATEREDSIRENLPSALQEVSISLIFSAFDDWLTQKYDTDKAGLPLAQSKHLPLFEKFYRELYHLAGMENPSSEKLSIPEKLAMIQLIQSLSPRPSGSPGSRPGSDSGASGRSQTPGSARIGGGPPFGFGGRSLREDFLEQFDLKLFDRYNNSVRETLEQMPPSARMEALQRMLALAVLKQYPAIDPRRIFQAIVRMDQEWNTWHIEILGSYISMMNEQRRNDILQQDSRFMSSRLQDELCYNTMPFFSLLRINRDNRDRPGGAMPPRGSEPPPVPGLFGPPGNPPGPPGAQGSRREP